MVESQNNGDNEACQSKQTENAARNRNALIFVFVLRRRLGRDSHHRRIFVMRIMFFPALPPINIDGRVMEIFMQLGLVGFLVDWVCQPNTLVIFVAVSHVPWGTVRVSFCNPHFMRNRHGIVCVSRLRDCRVHFPMPAQHTLFVECRLPFLRIIA